MMTFLLRLRKCDLLEVTRELGVEVNGDQPKVEIKDMILQNDKNDMETIKAVTEGILEEKEREFELEKLRIRLRNKLNENKLKAGNRINDLANVCILSGKRTAEVREPVNKGRLLNNPLVNKSVANATSCDFEKKNCDPPVRCTNVSHPSEVGRKEFNVNRSSDCDVEMKVGVCEGRVKTVAMGAQRVIIPDNIVEGSFELKRDKVCEKQLTVNRKNFRIHTIAKIAGPLKGKEDTCKADGLTCLEDGLAMRLPLSEPREIYKDSLETDNGSNIGSECSFEIDLPGKRDRSTIYCLNLIKLYRRKPELANLVMKNSSEGIDSETLYSVKLFMDVGFQGNLRKSQLYFKLPPDRSSYLRMINAKKKERFLPGPGTIVLRQKDINLVTGKPFRIKTCCSSQMLINSLREDTEYLLDLGVNGMGESNRTLPVVWLGRVNRYPYPRIKCIKRKKDPERERKNKRKVRGTEQKERTRDPERESAKPALNGEKGLSPEIGVKNTMNAGGVEKLLVDEALNDDDILESMVDITKDLETVDSEPEEDVTPLDEKLLREGLQLSGTLANFLFKMIMM
ncbi:uncharacterized protein TNCV_4492871 [Trichonephila clavipes]|uniref:Uncharacterized protein n=1 Tax=Trichonephila clavipes TaxID=2585209 RepID=A0A8X6VJF1_TRICX|nr:uncharacterized protein TNCV_4492871 [Trichonephila clavipes]